MQINATVTAMNDSNIVYIVLRDKRLDRFWSGERFTVQSDGDIALYANRKDAALALKLDL